MANVQHSVLTGADLHEPKGAAAATAKHVYVADGLGSGSFQLLNPFGSYRYNDIGTGSTYTGPTSYTIVNPSSTGGTLSDFTHNGSSRLTYTGTVTRHAHAVFDLSYKHSTGSGQDCYFAIHKNGSVLGTPNAEIVSTADSGNYQHVAMHFDDMMATNDYYELYCKTASGNVIVHTMYLFVMGMPG